jgi:magnesium transporter
MLSPERGVQIMIHTFALTQDNTLKQGVEINQVNSPEYKFFWVDLDQPTEQEIRLLTDFFHFHPLAIEDCLHFIQRPNMSFYDNVLFFVLHSLNESSLKCEEVDVFVGENYVVSFHLQNEPAMKEVIGKVSSIKDINKMGPLFILHTIIDELVDHYFPIMHQIEDKLTAFEENEARSRKVIDEVYDIRADLIRLRKTIIPMRDLLYRIVNSGRIRDTGQYQHYFADIYDHLMKLTDMLNGTQEITADMRENFMSVQSYKMNSIMMTLTVFTTIFMPLTFIVGVYGMNFENMPELHWRYGYFIVLVFMGLIAIGMSVWFYRKGWLLNK